MGHAGLMLGDFGQISRSGELSDGFEGDCMPRRLPNCRTYAPINHTKMCTSLLKTVRGGKKIDSLRQNVIGVFNGDNLWVPYRTGMYMAREVLAMDPALQQQYSPASAARRSPMARGSGGMLARP